ncbi:MAG: endo-1,4-beta-xylanase Z [Alistipes sp.]|nr:endo-1,4-beta-xylanase Z [Candidatus Alistipes equi]
MKRKALFLTFVLLAGMVLAKGKIEKFTIQSKVLGVEKQYNVYIPDGYDASSSKKYPVLYLLHGLGGSCESWPSYGIRDIADEMSKSGFSLPMFIVMPDAAGEGEKKSGWNVGYDNRKGWNYENFFIEELIPHVEKQFPIYADKRHRAITGQSMGGHGAFLFGLFYPEYFSSVCTMGGRLHGKPDTERKIHYANSIAPNDFVDNLPKMEKSQIDKLKGTRWYLDCADGDSLLDGSYGVYMFLRKNDIMAELRVRDGGHTKMYWKESIRGILTFVSIGFALE